MKLTWRPALVFALFVAGVDLLACADDAAGSRAMALPASASASAVTAVTWSPALELPSLAALTARFARPFPEAVDLVKGGVHLAASTCAQLLAARGQGASPAGDRELAIERDEGAKCIALDQLSRARAAQTSHLAGFALRAATPRQLPPMLATPFSKRDDERARVAEAQGQTLADYRPGVVVRAQDGALLLSGDTWESRIEILARGDFDGGGAEQILVAAHDKATEGRFESTRVLLLTRRVEGGALSTLKRLQ